MISKRGRPRSFDDDEIKRLITEEFQRKGFAATSLDDLARATGLTRPSLYGAFGDKLAMFLLAVDTFSEALGKTAGAALRDGTTVDAALSGFYEAILNKYFEAGDTSQGCLVFATAVSDAGSNPEIQVHLRKHFAQFESTLKCRIEELLPTSTDKQIEVVVRLSVSALHSMAVRARTGETRVALELSIKQTLAAIRSLVCV